MDVYEAMGFDVTQLPQDMEQSLFTIKTNKHADTHVSVWERFPVGKI